MAHAAENLGLAQLQEAMEQIARPCWVQSIDVCENFDADGELAIWVWIVVAPQTAEQFNLQDGIAELRQRIRQKLSEVTPGLWAYVRVREAESPEH